MREWRFYDMKPRVSMGFHTLMDSELAFETNRLMRNWIPIHAEGNGDYFSINHKSGRCFGNVIFDQHDWLMEGRDTMVT